jgi:hypothetical protein
MMHSCTFFFLKFQQMKQFILGIDNRSDANIKLSAEIARDNPCSINKIEFFSLFTTVGGYLVVLGISCFCIKVPAIKQQLQCLIFM